MIRGRIHEALPRMAGFILQIVFTKLAQSNLEPPEIPDRRYPSESDIKVWRRLCETVGPSDPSKGVP